MATVLITGASSGFGMAAALAFARRNDTVYATVRSEEKAAALRLRATEENLQIQPRILDVTRTETFPALIEELVAESGGIDVLVNNAGIIHPGAWEDLSESMAREVMEVNFFGPMFLTRTVLPHMRARGSGYIIMISSLSGLAGLAADVAYTASKFALEGATEALRHEVDRWGIHVALVEAGQYMTDLFSGKDELPASYPGDSPYRALVASKLQEFRAGQPNAMPASKVGDLLPQIAASDGRQLRWAADDMACYVLQKAHGLSDGERDEFLRGASGSDWWSAGLSQPNDSAIASGNGG